MSIDATEMIELGLEAEQLAEFIVKAIKPGPDGKKHLDKAEAVELVKKLGFLATHLTHAIIS